MKLLRPRPQIDKTTGRHILLLCDQSGDRTEFHNNYSSIANVDASYFPNPMIWLGVLHRSCSGRVWFIT